MAPLQPADVLNGRFCTEHLTVRQWARAYAKCPSGSERLEQAGRCSTSSWQASRRGNGTRAGGSGGIPWLAVIPQVGARLARFMQRPQTRRNPDQAGAGGARKPAALIPCLLPPFPLTPATKPAPQLKGAYGPPLGD